MSRYFKHQELKAFLKAILILSRELIWQLYALSIMSQALRLDPQGNTSKQKLSRAYPAVKEMDINHRIVKIKDTRDLQHYTKEYNNSSLYNWDI
jgi:hypothetical protein